MRLITAALAAWRLAHLLVLEDGPFAMFARLRYRAGLRHVVTMGQDGRPQASKVAMNTLAEGLTCVWCVSVWTAALMTLGDRFRIVRWLRDVLAISAGAIVFHEVTEWASYKQK